MVGCFYLPALTVMRQISCTPVSIYGYLGGKHCLIRWYYDRNMQEKQNNLKPYITSSFHWCFATTRTFSLSPHFSRILLHGCVFSYALLFVWVNVFCVPIIFSGFRSQKDVNIFATEQIILQENNVKMDHTVCTDDNITTTVALAHKC